MLNQFYYYITNTTLPSSYIGEDALYQAPNGYVHELYSQEYRSGLSKATPSFFLPKEKQD